MTIYTSEKVMPYVYMGIHRKTGEFYIGSRTSTKQTLPSHIDIYHYRTSSKKVKPIFDEFDWHIVAEFLEPGAAYTFEQELIYDNWDSPLKLNERHTHGGGAWCVTGKERSAEYRQKLANNRKGKAMSESAKQRISEAVKARPVSEETRAKRSAMMKGKKLSPETIAKREATKAAKRIQPKVLSEEHKAAISAAKRGRKLTPEHRQKLSEAAKNRSR